MFQISKAELFDLRRTNTNIDAVFHSEILSKISNYYKSLHEIKAHADETFTYRSVEHCFF